MLKEENLVQDGVLMKNLKRSSVQDGTSRKTAMRREPSQRVAGKFQREGIRAKLDFTHGLSESTNGPRERKHKVKASRYVTTNNKIKITF